MQLQTKKGTGRNLRQYRRLSFPASRLKTAAILAMIVDHFTASVLTWCLYPSLAYEMQGTCYEVIMFLRTLGRLAFPIFCFFIAEGALHTHDIKKYAGRLLLFGAISEIPFDLALFGKAVYPEYQNVYWTLFLGLAVIAFLEKYPARTPVFFFLRPAVMLAGLLAAHLIKSDYGAVGVLVIIAFYLCRRYRMLQIVIGVGLMLWELQNMWIWIPAVLFAFLLWNYDGTRGRSMKYFFYAFYPVHLLVFGLIVVFWRV